LTRRSRLMVAPLSNDALVATGEATAKPRPPRSPRDYSTGSDRFPSRHERRRRQAPGQPERQSPNLSSAWLPTPPRWR